MAKNKIKCYFWREKNTAAFPCPGQIENLWDELILTWIALRQWWLKLNDSDNYLKAINTNTNTLRHGAPQSTTLNIYKRNISKLNLLWDTMVYLWADIMTFYVLSTSTTFTISSKPTGGWSEHACKWLITLWNIYVKSVYQSVPFSPYAQLWDLGYHIGLYINV